MRIAVVFTGGTIGSTIQESISLNESSPYALLHAYQSDHISSIDFISSSPFTLLSENLEIIHVESLLKHLLSLLEENYDGIIVTHGSDTLSFTSTIVGTFFSNVNIPLFLIASHTPLDQVHSNALRNFACAVAYIEQKKPHGVFVAYENEHESFVSIHHACSLMASPQFSNDFYSYTPLYGTYEKNTFFLTDLTQTKEVVTLDPILCKRLLYIKPTPILNYDHFNLEGVSVVLHDLYHSGTTHEKKFLRFLESCEEKNIPVFCAPLEAKEYLYETTHRLQKHNVTFLSGISIELALARLLLTFGNSNNS